jgi:hypothetical protein
VAAQYGVLIKGAPVLEAAGRVTTVVLDKTGTLTHGRCSVQRVVWLRDDDGSTAASVTARRQLLRLIAAVESGSEHPLARAVTSYAAAQQKQWAEDDDIACRDDVPARSPAPPPVVEGVEAVPGRGIRGLAPAGWSAVAAAAGCAAGKGSGLLQPQQQPASGEALDALAREAASRDQQQPDGRRVGVFIGNTAWMEDSGVEMDAPTAERIRTLESTTAGATAVVAAVGRRPVAVVLIADVVKPEAFGALRALERRGLEVWMVTGDSRYGADGGVGRVVCGPADHILTPRDYLLANQPMRLMSHPNPPGTPRQPWPSSFTCHSPGSSRKPPPPKRWPRCGPCAPPLARLVLMTAAARPPRPLPAPHLPPPPLSPVAAWRLWATASTTGRR